MAGKAYRLIDEGKKLKISEEGALLIWAAYDNLYNRGGGGQSMECRESRGGIAHLVEIEAWIKRGALPKDFDYTQYLID